MQSLKNQNVILLSHILTTVPAYDLEKYFIQRKINRLLFIGHPLYYKKGRPGSFYRYYEKGKLVEQVSMPNLNLFSFILYLKDFLLTIIWILKLHSRWDIAICLDNLNTLDALLLKRISVIKKVIYYTIDFVPQRFNNKYFNNFYHYIDKLCLSRSDMTWNISPRIADGRQTVRSLQKSIYTKQITVPVGVWLDRIPKNTFEKRQKDTIVYAGGLLPHQGIQLVIQALPYVIKRIPSVTFKVIGIGSYEEDLKRMVTNLNIEKHVEFLGYFEKHEDVEKILCTCDIAVAMYSKKLDKWSYYADPSKIKTYLACGLPIITTSLTYLAAILEKQNCAIVVNYDKKDLAKAIITLLSDTGMQKLYRENALKYIKKLDWNIIFDQALDASLQ